MEQELLAALVVVLDRRLPGLARQMMVVLQPPPELPPNVVPLHGRVDPRPGQREAFAWIARAEQLLEEQRSFDPK